MKFLMPGTPEWEVAYFTDIQPMLSMAIDNKFPGFMDNAFRGLDEDEIMESFEQCCNSFGVSICEDDRGHHALVTREGEIQEPTFISSFQKVLARKMQPVVEQEEPSL